MEFRPDRRGPGTVVFHGGHTRAGLSLGEDVYAEAGCSVLVPSRPGYGRTPVSTGGSAPAFADATAALCEHLGITGVAAAVGVSGGGPTAVARAARHPTLVKRLIPQSAAGPLTASSTDWVTESSDTVATSMAQGRDTGECAAG
ncbi:alpha/beta hydrolase [Streptomyces sp. DT2A-34]|uniref:alpha/beta fold hydrolase n=1 Tax=Streptomyces sp. DT2A-34 TaxID=3051182 RepID=UPI00265BD588|nr:alpha/beta hydrolase [Streptomyces sp. DT2A-34]MDO0909854.1 alpha/beta hydrolase [Streptomyces sp. DT2A-34]